MAFLGCCKPGGGAINNTLGACRTISLPSGRSYYSRGMRVPWEDQEGAGGCGGQIRSVGRLA